MNKWGVRLIALLFIIEAISDVYGLMTGTRREQGFLGFDFTYNGQPSGVMTWVGIVIFVYAGVQILRFQPSGRYWALFIYWVLSLEGGGLFIWIIILWISDLSKGKSSGLAWNLNSPFWHGEVRGLPVVLLYFVGVFTFFFIPTYYLMRKDVKQLFEKNLTAELANIIPGAKP